MFAGKTQEMFGAACDHYFTFFQVNKLDRVADKISPCTRIRTHQQRIFFTCLYFMDHFCIGIAYDLSITIKILIIKWNKLEEDIIIKDQLHASGLLSGLISYKTFAG